MPRNTREWAQRKLDMAFNNLDWAGKHIYEMAEVYKKQHPEISEGLQLLLESIAATMNAIVEFKKTF